MAIPSNQDHAKIVEKALPKLVRALPDQKGSDLQKAADISISEALAYLFENNFLVKD